ncbi:MAG: hypothetical protein MUF83_00875 [Acidimicrobiales bacterium]|nr:hypothetical protein [Acidimicrobiales bacterium]
MTGAAPGVRPPAGLAALAVAAVLVLGACTDDDTIERSNGRDPAADTPTDTAADDLVPVAVVRAQDDDVDLTDVAEILDARLARADGPGAFQVSVDGDEVLVAGPPGEQSLALVEDLVTPGRLSLRPVLSLAPAGDTPGSTAGTVPPQEATGEVVATDVGVVYVVGPEALGGDGVLDAAVARLDTSGQWIVGLTFSPSGISIFNELAASCYTTSATCPTGQVALLSDDRLLMAPVMQSPSFAADAVQILGELDEDEARSLASTLASPNLPAGLTVDPAG